MENQGGAGTLAHAVAAVILAGMLVAALEGCWSALAPLAAGAAADVGSGVVDVAEGGVMMTHQKSDIDTDHPGEKPIEKEARCDDLERQMPGVIELRKSVAGSPEYRELQLTGSDEAQRWIPITDGSSDSAGWQPAVHFLQMDFVPPLTGAVPDSGSNYLAYAPAKPQSWVDEGQMNVIAANFGSVSGTFEWNGREYRYAVAHRLPCFPPPS